MTCSTVPYWNTADYDQTLVRAETAELQLEDLKLQLDDAMGAEDLLEQLTERNLTLNEVRPFSVWKDDYRVSCHSLCPENGRDARHH